MVVVPIATAVTTPSSTVATVSALELQVSALFVAFSGTKVAFNVPVSFTFNVSSCWSSATPVTATLAAATVTVHSAEKSPAVAVMIALPSLTGVTMPFATVAIVGADDVHVTSLLVASSGSTVATSAAVSPPAVISRVFLSNVMPVTVTPADRTVTTHLVETPSAVAIMSAVPSLTGVTVPSSDTVAISDAEDVHTMFLFVASSGRTFASNVAVSPPTSIVRLSSLTEILSTGIMEYALILLVVFFVS